MQENEETNEAAVATSEAATETSATNETSAAPEIKSVLTDEAKEAIEKFFSSGTAIQLVPSVNSMAHNAVCEGLDNIKAAILAL